MFFCQLFPKILSSVQIFYVFLWIALTHIIKFPISILVMNFSLHSWSPASSYWNLAFFIVPFIFFEIAYMSFLVLSLIMQLVLDDQGLPHETPLKFNFNYPLEGGNYLILALLILDKWLILPLPLTGDIYNSHNLQLHKTYKTNAKHSWWLIVQCQMSMIN